MAMIKCPNCGKDISDKANACPTCGKIIDVMIESKTIDNKDLNDLNEQTYLSINSNNDEINDSKNTKSKKKIGIIVALVAAIVVIAGGIGGFLYFNKVIKPANEYKEAENLLNDKKYLEAQQKFKALGDYEDSADKIIECDYASANDALEAGDYESAKSEFNKIIDYKDSSEKIKECDYQKALEFYNDGDYDNAIDIFSTIFDYSDTKHYVYSMYVELAGQEYVDEFSKGINYLSSYIQSQSSSLLTYAYSSYWGTSTDNSWSPDLDDKDIIGVEDCMTELHEKMRKFNSVFSTEVIKNCNDETLSTACDQFDDVHKSATDMLSTHKAMTYIADIVNGSTSTMENDTQNAKNAISNYTKTVNSMKGE